MSSMALRVLFDGGLDMARAQRVTKIVAAPLTDVISPLESNNNVSNFSSAMTELNSSEAKSLRSC